VTGRAATAVSLALLLAAPARGDGDGEVHGDAVLHLRGTRQANLTDTDVLFDPATRAFAVANYLGPSPREAFAASFVGASLEGSHLDGRLGWSLAVDSGLLRQQRFPEPILVCTSSGPTGLDQPGNGTCIAPMGFTRPLLFVVPSTTLESARLTANGRPVDEEIRDTLLVREAWAEARLGRARFLSLKAGRQRIAVGDGFVHDDYALGLNADADLGALGPPFDVSLAALWPTRGRVEGAQARSPMLALRADWTPSLFEHVGVFAAWSHDETGAAGGLLRAANAEAAVMRLQLASPGTDPYRQASVILAALLSRPPVGTSDLAWTGISGHLFPGDRHELWWTGAVVLGRLSTLVPGGSQGPYLQDVPVAGLLGRVRWRLAWTPAFATGAFVVFESGDLPPAERALVALPQRYDGFLGVTPYVTDLNLFFNGGISESFANRRATAPGVNGRGVLAPGLSASWNPSLDLSVESRGAWLLADETGPYGGRVYGMEIDLNVSWSPWRWLALLAEADVLFPGDFFPSSEPMRRFIVGVNVSTP
jgi:hypothetical protein